MYGFQLPRHINFKSGLTTAMLAISFGAGNAHAAYYVDEDTPQITALRPTVTSEPVITEIPFLLGKAALGPNSRAALNRMLPEARRAERITITAYATPARRGLAKMRTSALKRWFTDNGVPAYKIETGEDMDGMEDSVTVSMSASTPMARPAETALLVKKPALSYAPLNATPTAAPTRIDIGNPSEALMNDPVKLAFANRLVGLWQKKILKSDDAMQLLADILKGKEQENSSPAATSAQLVATSATPAQTAAIVRQIEVAPESMRAWNLNGDRTLQENIQGWATIAGYKEFVWNVPTQYQIKYSSTINGTFIDALNNVNKMVPELDFHLSKNKQKFRVDEKR